jgi:glycine/D-amino acid oxidase-like deaminating enzyme
VSSNESFTLIVVPDRHAEVKRFHLRKIWIVQALAAVAVLLLVGLVMTGHYVSIIGEARENPNLRDENLKLKSELAVIREKVAYERELGLETEVVSPAEMRAIAPNLSEHLVGAAFDPTEGLANPLLVTPTYVRLATAHGARFRIHTAVTGTEVLRGGGFLVTTSGGTIRAKRIVNAAGPWAGVLAAIAGAPLPVQGHVIQATVTERREPILDQLIQHVRPALSLKQTTLGTFMIGGGWPATIDPATGRPTIDPASVVGNLGVALRVLPALRDVQVVRSWPGVMAHSEDRDGQRLQIFGELPSVPGYYVIAGGTLFTMGPLFSRLGAELITTGTTSYPVDIFHPERFGRGRSVQRP